MIADWSAGAMAVVILGLGGLVVVKPAVDHWDAVYRGTPFEVRTSTQRVNKERAGNRETTTTTEASSSFVERLLGKSGLLVMRLCLVAILAFLAAAIVQRVILGRYGLRAQPADIPAPAATTENASNGTLPTSQAPEPDPVAAPTQNGPTAAQGPTNASLAPGIAKLLASRREALGLSQRELAKRAGVNHTVISRVEGGEHAPSPRTLERLADALH
jgi:DNA-binding XRE family transcriptional regulator